MRGCEDLVMGAKCKYAMLLATNYEAIMFC